MAEGLFEALCKGNELGVEEAYGIVLTTACTLVMQVSMCVPVSESESALMCAHGRHISAPGILPQFKSFVL